MSARVIRILVAAGLIAALVIVYTQRERTQAPTNESAGISGGGNDSATSGGPSSEAAGSGSVIEPTDSPDRTREVVIGEPVNPTIDRRGIPVSETVQLTPEELARIRSSRGAGGAQPGAPGSSNGESPSTNLPGPGSTETSDPGHMGLAPEAGVPQILGPAPEAGIPDIPGPAPEAGVPQIPGTPPDAGGSNIPGPAPEASDAGLIGPAPEAGGTGPGGPPPEGN